MFEPVVHHITDESLGYEGFIAIDAPPGWLSFGGLRVAPSVDAETMCCLAEAMRLKFALHGLPIGGAKGGLRCDAAHAHRPEVIRSFVARAETLLRTQVILGKDLGASNELLDHCYEQLGAPQLSLPRERWSTRCPARVRDLCGYVQHMTGLGVAWSADAAMTSLGLAIRGARVIVQGCGRVGRGSAIRLAELGAVVIGINDHHGAIVHEAGIPCERIVIDGDGTIELDALDFPHSRIERDALLGVDADVLVLAAGSGLVDPELARSIRARIIVEGANAPIVPAADRLLAEAGHLIIPDIVASSSSAALVGHQLVSGNSRAAEQVWAEIEHTIRTAVSQAVTTSRATGCSPRAVLGAELRAKAGAA